MPVRPKLKGMHAPDPFLHPEIFRPIRPVSGPATTCREGFSAWHIVAAGLASAPVRERLLRSTRHVWSDTMIADLAEATFRPIADSFVLASGGTVTPEGQWLQRRVGSTPLDYCLLRRRSFVAESGLDQRAMHPVVWAFHFRVMEILEAGDQYHRDCWADRCSPHNHGWWLL